MERHQVPEVLALVGRGMKELVPAPDTRFVPEVTPEGFVFQVKQISEAGDRLVKLCQLYDEDSHKAVEEVEALDVYKARRILALALGAIHDLMEDAARDAEA